MEKKRKFFVRIPFKSINDKKKYIFASLWQEQNTNVSKQTHAKPAEKKIPEKSNYE